MPTLADLPSIIASRGSQPRVVRRCRDGGFTDWSAGEVAETIRQAAAGLLTAGLHAGDRLAIVAESRRPRPSG